MHEWYDVAQAYNHVLYTISLYVSYTTFLSMPRCYTPYPDINLRNVCIVHHFHILIYDTPCDSPHYTYVLYALYVCTPRIIRTCSTQYTYVLYVMYVWYTTFLHSSIIYVCTLRNVCIIICTLGNVCIIIRLILTASALNKLSSSSSSSYHHMYST